MCHFHLLDLVRSWFTYGEVYQEFCRKLNQVVRVLPKVEPSSVPRIVLGRYGFRYGEGALTVLWNPPLVIHSQPSGAEEEHILIFTR